MIVKEVIQVRGQLGLNKVIAWRLQDWAIHPIIGWPALWCITHIPTGQNLPQTWASFDRPAFAAKAMREIVRVRNDWHRAGNDVFTKAVGAQLKEICVRHGSVRGPNSFQCAPDETVLGTEWRGRLNGYARAS